ncbi:MAG TPA: NYN domain-containing protein, partial [Clostridiales bacterium]|nr:NYN domain-containing protein [Clostridiales bacterium]
KFDTIPERTKGGGAGLTEPFGQKVMVFLDYANINRSARDKNIEIDYSHFLDYITGGRFLLDAFAYFPVDPRAEHATDFDKQKLWKAGYHVNEKVGTIAGESYKCNFDIEMTMDMLKAVYHARPDVIVLASGDGDFIPLVYELRKMGIRTEVAAFPVSASKDIALKCSGFIDLDIYYSEYLDFVDGSIDVSEYPPEDDTDSEDEADVSEEEKINEE